MSNLLINESPLQLLPALACLIGVEEAVILQQIHFLCQNGASGKILDDGHKYVWNTYEEWQVNVFPFWSVSTVKRKFLLLEEQKLLVSEQPYKKNRNNTKYYRVDTEKLQKLSEPPENIDEVKLTRCTGSDWDGGTGQIEPVEQVKLTRCTGSDWDGGTGQIEPVFKGTETSSETSNRDFKTETSTQHTDSDFVRAGKSKKITLEILNGIRKRQKLNVVSREPEWVELADFAYANSKTSEFVFLLYDTLEKQKQHPKHWRSGRITPKTIKDNFAELNNLQKELEDLDNAGNTGKPNTERQKRLDELAEFEAGLSHQT